MQSYHSLPADFPEKKILFEDKKKKSAFIHAHMSFVSFVLAFSILFEAKRTKNKKIARKTTTDGECQFA